MEVRIRGGPRILFAAVVGALLALPASASAQINYSGYTNGCFGSGCTPTNSNGAFQWTQLTMTNSTLRFANSSFSGTVNQGDLFALNTAATALFQQQINNLGAFYLTMTGNLPDTYSNFFTLAVRFVDPGTGNGFYTATLSGTIRVGQSAPNRVDIAFATPHSQQINWVNNVTGEVGVIDFDLTSKVIVIAGQLNQTSRAHIAGEGTITVAPEPISMILVGSGLFGVAGVARRRRRYLEGSATEA